MKFRETFSFGVTYYYYTLWKNSDKAGKALEYRNYYSEIFGEILEYGKFFQSVFKKLGRNFERNVKVKKICITLEKNWRNIWKSSKKLRKSFEKIENVFKKFSMHVDKNLA